MGRNRATRKFGARLRAPAVLAAVLLTVGTLTTVAAPPIGADCPTPLSGHYTGTWASSTAPAGGTVSENITFSGGTLSGTVSLTGSPYPGGTVSGVVSCGDITVGTLDAVATFTGTIAADGRSSSGTYTAGTDNGTWAVAYDTTPLVVTQTVQPTTITSTGAASWVISVYNPGPNPATNVVALFDDSNRGYGELSQFVSSNGSCFFTDDHGGETPSFPECTLGDLAPGQTQTASGTLLGTGVSAPDTITANAYAFSDIQAGVAVPVTVTVVPPALIPPGEASGLALPAKNFETSGKLSPVNPIKVKFKLPPRIAAGTAMRLAKHRVQLMSFRPGLLPRALTIRGPAVPMSISHTPDEALTFCNGVCTGDVIHLAPFSHYTDPKHPAKVTIIWDHTQFGAGTLSTIYKRSDSPQSPTTTLRPCIKTKTTGYTNLPCVFSRKVIKAGALQYILLMLSGDPKFARR